MIKWMRHKFGSLRYRLRALLVVSAILPLVLIWIFANTWVLSLYRENTRLTILSELGQIKENMELLMESMTYMSQQIVADAEFMTKLRETGSQDEVLRANALIFLNRRINVYEGANPNISNLVFFYLEDGEPRNINYALVPDLHIQDELLFSTQHLIRFYGPHPTQSQISNYPAISLLRRMPVPGVDNLYLYMESGYSKLGTFSAATLDSIKAVYTVISDADEVVYTSDPQSVPLHMSTTPDDAIATINGQRYFPYQLTNTRGWALRVYVPVNLYNEYMITLSLGFIVVALVAILLSILLSGILWRSVNRPFRLFDQNLQAILQGHREMDIQTIHVEEFDQNFAYFAELRARIAELLRDVQRQEQQKATLEVRQLLYKINPHFIHNTLNTLKWYAADRGYGDIETFLAAFNRLMLYNMERSGAPRCRASWTPCPTTWRCRS